MHILDELVSPGTVGLVGVALYLGSYFALQAGLIRGQSYAYAFLNLLAASCVLYNLKTDFNLSSAVIQIAWITISLVGMARLYFIAKYYKLRGEEALFINSKFPDLPMNLARRFLDSGEWRNSPPGTILTNEGAPVPELVYISDGSAVVTVGEREVAQVQRDSFIGEITCLKGTAATATVTIHEASRCFFIPAEKLRRLVQKNAALRQAFEASFAADVQRKLLANNDLKKARPGDPEPA